MIEWQKAKTGHKIPFIDNKAMASMVNPIKEAKTWAKRAKSELYADTESIIVLGVGAAYHIEELAKITDKKIYCIDLFQDFILAKENTNNINFYYIDQPSNYWSTPSVCSEIKGKLQIFMHGPSIQSRKSTYFALRNEICLRTKEAIANYKRNFGEISGLAMSSLKNAGDSDLLDLGRTCNTIPLNSGDRNSIVWKTLGDLIK